jgi:hypothetical protein
LTVKVAEVEWSAPRVPAAVFPFIYALITTAAPVAEVALEVRIFIPVPEVVAHMSAFAESHAKLMVQVL